MEDREGKDEVVALLVANLRRPKDVGELIGERLIAKDQMFRPRHVREPRLKLAATGADELGVELVGLVLQRARLQGEELAVVLVKLKKRKFNRNKKKKENDKGEEGGEHRGRT